MLSPAERFLSKVDRSGDCWPWLAGKSDKDYGWFWFRAKTWKAHRVAYVLFCGEIPDGMDVLHRCDNPPCVNPDHLFLGTNQDNVEDRDSKGRGRQLCGESHGCAKLTQAQVDEIRARYVRGNGKVLAKEFGIQHQEVSRIIRGITWRAAPQESAEEAYLRGQVEMRHVLALCVEIASGAVAGDKCRAISLFPYTPRTSDRSEPK